MQTIQTNDLVSGAFEACAEFSTLGHGSPVCEGCGWLETEHDHTSHPAIAEVRTLPARKPTRVPKRLAS